MTNAKPELAEALEFTAHVARKWARDHHSGITPDEAEALAQEKTWERWERYDPGKVSDWHQYFGQQAQFALIDEMRRRLGRTGHKANREVSYQNIPQNLISASRGANADWDNQSSPSPEFTAALGVEDDYVDLAPYAIYLLNLRDPLYTVLLDRLNDVPPSETARKMKVSASRVSQLRAAIKRDFLCWDGSQPCGKQRCPRCWKPPKRGPGKVPRPPSKFVQIQMARYEAMQRLAADYITRLGA